MTERQYKAAILDLDGVITRTAEIHARAWKQMFDEYLETREGNSARRFDLDRDYRRYVDGKPRYDGVQSFLSSRSIDLPFGEEVDDPETETVCGLGNRKNEIFHQILQYDGVKIYEDAVEQIDRWKRRGLTVAVISSSRNCEAVLKSAGLSERFDLRIDGNDLARLELEGKPAPDMFLRAARELGVEPAEAIVVEDAVAGVQAGRQGHFGLVVGVARNGDHDQLLQAGADRVVHDLRELGDRASDVSAFDQVTTISAVEQFDQISRFIEGKKLGLFLDYDGTLTPIVRRPEEATLSEEMRALLADLAGQCTVVIVSGRDRRNAEEMVNIEELVYAGSHGFDIRGPGGLEKQQKEAQQALPDLDAAEQELRSQVEAIPGAHLERKRFAIAVHYREVADERVQQVEVMVDRVLGEHPGLRKRGGKKIFELQPDIPWDKGRAVLWLMDVLNLEKPKAAAIYLGDDETDEDAFTALHETGAGIGIRVTERESETRAEYHLRNCEEVQGFLQSLLAFLSERKAAH